MGPEPLQAGQHVLVLRQFDLRLGVGRLRTHGEDVEDERGAVQDFHLEFTLDVSYLFGRQFVVEDDHADFRLGVVLAGLDVFLYLGQFALAHIGHGVGLVDALGETGGHLGPGRLGQEGQFVQVFVRLALVLRLGDEAYQHRLLGLCLGYYKFFHVSISSLYLYIGIAALFPPAGRRLQR